MTKQKELIFLFSVMFLQVKNFLPFGGERYVIFSGDNLILVVGMAMVLTSTIFKKVILSKTTLYAYYAGVVFLLIIPFYLYIKNFLVFGGNLAGLGTLVRTLLRLIFIYYFLKYLNISDAHYKKGLNTIMIFGVIITLSMLFEDVFINLGFTVDKYKTGLDIELITENARFAGITGMNVNDLGAVLSIFIGILFYMYKNKLVKVYPFLFYLTFLSVGLMLTGSRTAFIITNLLILFFLRDYLKRISIQSFILILFLFPTIFIIYETFGIATITRLEQNIDTEYFGLGTRAGYWGLYLLDIAQNPIYLLMGNTAPSTYPRSAHNYYVQIVFQTGIILVTVAFSYLFSSIYSKRFTKYNSNILSIDFKYVLLPQLIIWITSSSYISWFALIAIAIAGIFFDRGYQLRKSTS